ncbi:hypothetical protein [Streptomyces smyrnaeus]|uniref:hypothetical protein n=1 Tax=Streptomyces smyrnaeus TaxID=1387713 RepID=UPI00369EA573
MLPKPPPGVVPFIAGRSEEESYIGPLTLLPGRTGLAYTDETPYDRDSFGALWVRAPLRPKARRGKPRLERVHAFRQRRCMLDMRCQVCRQSPPAPDGPHLFLMRDVGRPVEEGERTTSPPVCVPCAVIAVQVCPPLRDDGYVAAWVGQAPAWGIAGTPYTPGTVTKIPGRDLVQVEYGTRRLPWVVAARTVVALHTVAPADLHEEAARMGPVALEREFARIAAVVAGTTPARKRVAAPCRSS